MNAINYETNRKYQLEKRDMMIYRPAEYRDATAMIIA
jgi:hypothetical protein